SGQATFTTSKLKKGNHSITAVYNDADSHFNGSSSPVLVQVVKNPGNGTTAQPLIDLQVSSTSSTSTAQAQSWLVTLDSVSGSPTVSKGAIDSLFASADPRLQQVLNSLAQQTGLSWSTDWVDLLAITENALVALLGQP